ncbi:MAG: R3H domain-containing nucleic acid-binding protein [Patescibacteria group bacterium]
MNSENTSIINDFIRRVAEYMQIPCEVSVSSEEGGSVSVAVQADDNGRLLIGKNGQNLKALEHVVRVMWMRQNPENRSVIVDVNDYRAERSKELIQLVRETAARVQQTRRSEAFEPMTSYERRLVHTELATYSDLSTESVGQDPQRRVVIKPL